MAFDAESDRVGCGIKRAHGAVFDDQAIEAGVPVAPSREVGGGNEWRIAILNHIDFVLNVMDFFNVDSIAIRVPGSQANRADVSSHQACCR